MPSEETERAQAAAFEDATALLSVVPTGPFLYRGRLYEKERAERDRPDWFAAEERATR